MGNFYHLLQGLETMTKERIEGMWEPESGVGCDRLLSSRHEMAIAFLKSPRCNYLHKTGSNNILLWKGQDLADPTPPWGLIDS